MNNAIFSNHNFAFVMPLNDDVWEVILINPKNERVYFNLLQTDVEYIACQQNYVDETFYTVDALGVKDGNWIDVTQSDTNINIEYARRLTRGNDWKSFDIAYILFSELVEGLV